MKAKEEIENEELSSRKDELKKVQESKSKKEAEIDELTKKLEESIIRTQEERLRLEDVKDASIKDEQRTIIANNENMQAA